jgi:hypothetical protein
MRTRDVLGGIALLLFAVPVSLYASLLLLPLWRWIEANLHVEAVGHSGPADWCFVATYAVVAAAGGLVWFYARRT